MRRVGVGSAALSSSDFDISCACASICGSALLVWLSDPGAKSAASKQKTQFDRTDFTAAWLCLSVSPPIARRCTARLCCQLDCSDWDAQRSSSPPQLTSAGCLSVCLLASSSRSVCLSMQRLHQRISIIGAGVPGLVAAHGTMTDAANARACERERSGCDGGSDVDELG